MPEIRDGLTFYSAGEIESDWAIHPGELLGEEIKAHGMTQKGLAEALGRPPQAINEIVRGKKAITADTAVGLERVWGTPAYLWLRMQAAYELVLARQRAAAAEARSGAGPSPRAPRAPRAQTALRGVAEDTTPFSTAPQRRGRSRTSKPRGS